MNSGLTAAYASGSEKREDVVSYPFEYIREKCSICPKAERCMFSIGRDYGVSDLSEIAA